MELMPGTANGWDVRANDGRTFPKTEGRYLWRAWHGTRVLEGAAYLKPEAERFARDAELQLAAEDLARGA